MFVLLYSQWDLYRQCLQVLDQGAREWLNRTTAFKTAILNIYFVQFRDKTKITNHMQLLLKCNVLFVKWKYMSKHAFQWWNCCSLVNASQLKNRVDLCMLLCSIYPRIMCIPKAFTVFHFFSRQYSYVLVFLFSIFYFYLETKMFKWVIIVILQQKCQTKLFYP